jgi:lysophospholipid acyltransferase (LPLAT)-like uncharacterized protein
MSNVSLAPENRPADRRRQKSGVVVPHHPRLRQRFAARLVYLLVRCISATVRYELDDDSGFFRSVPAERLIFAIWHNRLALSLMIYRRYVGKRAPERRLAAMVSASRDGGLLTRILELFGVRPVRGSSSRRGPQALREMLSCAEAGFDLAITPDGPRGPCYQVQDGVLSAAQLTGMPVVPVSYHLTWKIRPRSWDRFQIPLPFTRCIVHLGKAIHVPRDATDAEREMLRAELERSLRAISKD